MSSAILYVAIVAIWACVLIPRWLRRDSARGASSTSHEIVPGDVVPDDAVPGDVVAGNADYADVDRSVARSGDAMRGGSAVRADVAPERAKRRGEADERQQETAAEAPADDAPPPPAPGESRRRIRAARRRLLIMLLALQAAAIALAVLGLAALWVIIPPSVMLAGYMLLLREAAHADAERAEREWEAALARAHARELARARAHARAARRSAAPSAAPATSAAPASPAARYEDTRPGRDFAPGLAGKYTTSNADVIDTPEPADDRYLRAVGD